MKKILLLIIMLNMILTPCFAYEYKGIKVSGKQEEEYYSPKINPPEHEFTPVYFKYISDHEKMMTENLELPNDFAYWRANTDISLHNVKIYKTGEHKKPGRKYVEYCNLEQKACIEVNSKVRRYVKNDPYIDAVLNMLGRIKFKPFYEGMDVDYVNANLNFRFSKKYKGYYDNGWQNEFKYDKYAGMSLVAKTKEPVYIFKPRKKK